MLRKYPNRRIYDTEVAGYTTVAAIRPAVLAGESVLEHQGGREVTAVILAEMIRTDVLAGKGPTPQQLREFIRTYSLRGPAQVAAPSSPRPAGKSGVI